MPTCAPPHLYPTPGRRHFPSLIHTVCMNGFPPTQPCTAPHRLYLPRLSSPLPQVLSQLLELRTLILDEAGMMSAELMQVWGGVARMFGKAVQDALKTADEVGGGRRRGGGGRGGGRGGRGRLSLLQPKRQPCVHAGLPPYLTAARPPPGVGSGLLPHLRKEEGGGRGGEPEQAQGGGCWAWKHGLCVCVCPLQDSRHSGGHGTTIRANLLRPAFLRTGSQGGIPGAVRSALRRPADHPVGRLLPVGIPVAQFLHNKLRLVQL